MTNDYSVTVRREIAAPAEDLFDAWLDAESLATWLRPASNRETRVDTDPRVGGTFRFAMGGDESVTVCTGSYLEIDRPRRLVFTWSSPDTEHRDSIVTVTFEPSANSTVVEIHQVGLPDERSRDSHHAGWSKILRELGRTAL
ncbi:MAG TPA: SRPBCC domain-containing protein [Acidimicrobiales bacterium]|nr:SRPBCC domain-containing protein [Acidimicrobiales bacterium]